MSEWQTYKLREVGTLQRGRSRHRPRYAFHLFNGPYPFIQTGEVREARKHNSAFENTYSEAGLAQSKLWPKGTLCITIAANIAELGILGFDACFPDSVLGFIPDTTKSDLDFVYYTLTYFQKQLKHIGEGSVQDNINLGTFEDIEFPFPSLPEQKAIASVLSSLDDKIDLLHRQNKTLEAMAETLFRQWFIEEAKEDWEVTPLSRIFDFLEGPGIRNWQYVENGVNFINIRLIDVGEVNVNSANKISEEEAFGKYKHFMLEEGDLIVSTSGTLGKSAIIRKYHLPLCLNTSVIRFRPKQDIYREFMYSYLKSRVFLEELETTASGSVQLNFGPTHLKKIDIRLPPTELIMSYHTITSEVFNKINSNFEQIQTLEKLRDTLLPKLMSGEVRVQFKQESAA